MSTPSGPPHPTPRTASTGILLGCALCLALLGAAAYWTLRQPALDLRGWQVDEDLAADYDRMLHFHFPEYRLVPGTLDSLLNLEPRWERVDEARGGFESPGEGILWLPGAGADTTLAFEAEADWPADERDRSVSVRVQGLPPTVLEVERATRFEIRIPAARLRPDALTHAVVSCAPRCRRLKLSSVRSSVAVPRQVREARWFPRGSFAAPGRIEQLPGAHLSLALRPKPGARFVAQLPPSFKADAVDYTVVVEPLAGPRFEQRVSNARWRHRRIEVPLDRFQGQPLRLRLEVSRSGADSSNRTAAWLNPLVLSPARPAPATKAPASRPNVLLYVADTLRADHLQPYGYTRDVSPRLQAFADEALLFEHAYAQSVWTKPSVGSLLSGLLPEEHLAVDDLSSLGPRVRLLPSYLAPLGYASLGLQANGFSGPRYGFDRGFDRFIEFSQDLKDIRTWDSSAVAHQKLAELLPGLRTPWFVYVQVIDTHSPYGADGVPHRELRGHPYRQRPFREVFEPWLRRQARDARELALQTSYLKARYDGAVRHNDEHFGKLLDLLDELGQRESTAVVFTADHGEAFGEHGWDMSHSTFYEATARVPLIVQPAGWRGGRRVETPVQHIDIAATVLDWAGLPVPAELRGRSLLQALGADVPEPRSIHISFHPDRELGRFQTRGRAVVSWPYKFVQMDTRRAAYEIYDLAEDPDERRSLWDGMPPQASLLADFLLAEARRRPLVPLEPTRVEKLTSEERELLRAVGYVQ